MKWFKRKSPKERIYEEYLRKLEESRKMSSSNRMKSDQLMFEANELLAKWESMKE
jgi:hypothetical protein